MYLDTNSYRIYPSLLIAYQGLLDYETIYNEYWGNSDEPKYTLEEFYLLQEAKLIDSINRVPFISDKASCGTAFNEIVDCLIENRKSGRDDCKIYSAVNDSGIKVIRAEIDGFVFDFDIALCKQIAEVFKGSVTQYKAEADIDTAYGTVHLYGYIDEWLGNKIYDFKTTGSYNWGKYEKGWQRWVYPYCVIEAGDTTEVESFTYFVVEWAYQPSGQPLTAKGIHEETYTYGHAEATRKIRSICESFIEWLDSRREFIQDRRIFGGENPPGWHGQPTDIDRLEKYIFNLTV